MGCPLPPYIKEQGEEAAGQVEARQGGVGKERERRRRKEGGRPPFPKQIRFGPWGARPTLPLLPSISTKAHVGPLNPRGGSGNPSGSPVKSRFHPEPFRSPNIVVLYIDLYVSAVLRLLVMSPISSGTPNYLRYIKTYKLIIPIITEL